MVSVVLEDIWKSFGDLPVLKSLNLKVNSGEFMVILGPSGSGKTTTLKITAGLIKQDSGHVLFNGEIVDDLPPWERNLGFVFQNLALFPHMTVRENIAFGLEVRGFSKSVVKERVDDIIDLLGLRGLEDRYPRQLSGGQQQRVAIARALVLYPKLLLMDEPFANLDALLREQLREEIRKILKEIGLTTIFVTHDQYEALQLADKIAIMMDGKILQVGSPSHLFQNPASVDIAKFLKLNVLEVTEDIKHFIGDELDANTKYLAFSSRDLELSTSEGIPGRVIDKHFVRDYWICEIRLLDGQTLNVATFLPPSKEEVKIKIKRFVSFTG